MIGWLMIFAGLLLFNIGLFQFRKEEPKPIVAGCHVEIHHRFQTVFDAKDVVEVTFHAQRNGEWTQVGITTRDSKGTHRQTMTYDNPVLVQVRR